MDSACPLAGRLGALLLAITFGESEKAKDGAEPRYWHSVGMAKPLGYGAVAARIVGANVVNVENESVDAMALDYQKDRIAEFLTEACKFLGIENSAHAFNEQKCIKELLAMADSAHCVPAERLTYPGPPSTQGGDPNLKAFADAKKAGQILPPFSVIRAEYEP